MSVRICRRRVSALALAAAGAVASSLVAVEPAQAQVATLGKGYQYFLNNGLQIWGLDQGASTFSYNGLTGANFNGVMWSYGQDYKAAQLTAGQKWGKWVDASGTPATALDATQQSKINDLLALQVGDEQQSDLENPNGTTAAWFHAAQSGNNFPNQLLYVNSFFVGSDANYASFIGAANPDAISFDSYPFDNPYGSVIFPHNWLSKAGQFRRHALSSYLGIGGNAPRPYGMYLQTYAAQESATAFTRDPGDVEMRWQQFTAWTMGFSWVDAFHVGSSSSSLFLNGNMTTPSQPRYDQFKETSRQSRNLGPALTRLISYGYGPSIVIGIDAAGNNNPVPGDWLPFAKGNAPANQQYLTSLSALNTGTKNNSQPGDIYVGFFNPLHASLGDPAGEAYFMVTNALGPYLNDPTATVADCQQQITMNFDTAYSGVTTLQRLRRSDGQLEIVPLTKTAAAGRQYAYAWTLEGGTGDLFKYNDGTPFVGFNNTLYWDNDGNAGNNNSGTGAGLGGAGTWDAASNKWFNGSANSAWAGNRDAIFTGAGGAVTLAAPQAVNSLTFKSNGYSINGSALTMAGQWMTSDAGVSATINSSVAGSGGVVKAGPGTLVLTNAGNTYTGGTTVLGGVLQIASDGTLTDTALGAAPGSFTAANIILNGGTLRFGADLNLNNNRGIDIGPGGGTIDTQGFSNAAGYNATAGGFRGPGDLTKLGSGTFFASATTGGANTTWKGKLIIKEGTWKIVASDGLPYNAPAADGLQGAQVTLDGGTWQVAPPSGSLNITNVRRGITVASGGGTIDTASNNFTWAGPILGGGTVTKVGSGLLRLSQGAGTPSPYTSTFSGTFNVNGGTLQLDNGTAMGDLASINVANASGATLSVQGNETIGSLAGGGSTGGAVSVGLSNTLTTGGNNASTTFGGVISGNGSLMKIGSGTMTLTGTNGYFGTTTISGGTIAAGNQQNLGNLGNLLVLNGGTLKATNGFAMSRPLTVNAGTSTIDATGANVVFFAMGNTTFNGNLNIAGGEVYVSRSGGVATVAPGVTVNVAPGALFGLGGSGGALSDGVDHVNIVNSAGSSFYAFPGSQSGANHVVGTIDGAGITTLDANATLTATHVRQSALTVGGTVVVRTNGAASGASEVDAITIGASGKFDLRDNKLVTKNAAGSASGGGVYSGLQGDVQRAYNFGAWDQGGLTTSMPDAVAGLTTIAVSTGAAARGLGATETDVFAGRTITGASTIAMYTYAGDANLDGVIDGGDYGVIDNFVQVPGADGYANGDFNYDGVIDGGDYGIIDNNIQAQGAPFSTAGPSGAGLTSSVSPVPEPGACGLAILAAAATSLRRRRRSPRNSSC